MDIHQSLVIHSDDSVPFAYLFSLCLLLYSFWHLLCCSHTTRSMVFSRCVILIGQVSHIFISYKGMLQMWAGEDMVQDQEKKPQYCERQCTHENSWSAVSSFGQQQYMGFLWALLAVLSLWWVLSFSPWNTSSGNHRNIYY